MNSKPSSWNWSMSPRAEKQFSEIDRETQNRIVSKLDEEVSSEWREDD